MIRQSDPLPIVDNALIVVHDIIGDAHVVHVFSEVDISTAPELEAEMSNVAEAGRVIVELSDCRYMDTSLDEALRAPLADGPANVASTVA